jgi:urease accessory protein
MIRVEEIQGNLLRGFVPPAGAELDELRLTRWDAQKRRLRKRTAAGRDVAISLARPGALADGDVLHADRDVTIVATVEAGEVLVLTLDPTVPPAQLALNALRLGHVLGNQHWPLRIHDSGDGAAGAGAPEIVVPLSLDRRVVDAVVRSHRLEGVTYAFRAAEPGEILDETPVPPAHLNDHAYTAAHAHNGHAHDGHDHGDGHGHD